jgi:Co/Zn/Cd efflux system component
MSTHAGALLIAALAYTYSRRYADDARLAFGTGKLGDLAAFTSAIALAMIALLIGYESVDRLISPVPIAFNQAIPIALVGLGVMSDLHLWRLGPGHLAAVISVVTHEPRAPDHYKRRLGGLRGLSHVTVEVVRVREDTTDVRYWHKADIRRQPLRGGPLFNS